MIWLDELPPRWAGLAGFCAVLSAGLVVLRLPTWGVVGGLFGLLLLLVWLALSGKPVVKLVFAPEAAAAPQAPTPQPVPFTPAPPRVAPLLDMVPLPGGELRMGSPGSEVGRYDNEARHRVWVSEFEIAKFPVTQGQYAEVMGENPSYFQDPADDGERPEDRPVEGVSWFDAVRFCNRRSELEGLKPCYDLKTWKCDFTADGYRLPTEAEWEYACRAGTTSQYYFGNTPAKLGNYGWYDKNSGGRPRPVGQKLPNAWGLYDMCGNVWQWCNDFYKVDYYAGSPKQDPRGPDGGENKVVRGGAWRFGAESCRSGFRYNESPGYSDVCFGYDIYGFRCVRRAPAGAVK